jgi:predicted ATPase
MSTPLARVLERAAMKAGAKRVRIEELRLAGFRAFENARVALDDLTVLIGRNGSGKSTVIDALEFLRDALGDSLGNALERRGGLQALAHKSKGPKSDLSIAAKVRLSSDYLIDVAEDSGLEAHLPGSRSSTEAWYGFRLGPRRGGSGFAVKSEVASVRLDSFFERLPRDAEKESRGGPPLAHDALALPHMAQSRLLFRALFEALRDGIRVYSPSAAAIRTEPPVGRASVLLRDGSNLGDVLRHVEKDEADLTWVVKHLGAITPGLVDLKAGLAAGRRLVRFFQQVDGSKARFDIGDMSDGTLRCLAILLALRQRPAPAIVCIDEIEDSVHPAALGVLLDAVAASTERCQVLLTSHSPEALSHPAVTAERIRVVEWRDGRSDIFRLSPGAEEMSRPPRSVGKLLRANALFTSERPERVEGDFFEVA